MKKKLILAFLASLIFTGEIFSQINNEKNIILKSALAISLEGMNRNSLSQKDLIEKLIVSGKWKAPYENSTIIDSEKEYSWKKIEAGEDGWFNSPELKSGYAYCEVDSPEERTMLLQAMAYTMVYVNGEPRTGNVYLFNEVRQPWEPQFNYSFQPIKLKKGKNEFLFQVYYGRMKAVLHEVKSDVLFNTVDLTLPDIRIGGNNDLFGGVILINASNNKVSDLYIKTSGESFIEKITEVPLIQSLSTRKVRFDFSGCEKLSRGEKELKIEVIKKSTGQVLDSTIIKIRVLGKEETYRKTFISKIDGSVQYFAINPCRGDSDKKQALFFSLHGANVEALNQAGSYYSKLWGIIAAPTNRRPFGFNWEDWGRQDALEVFDLVNKEFKIDESRIYLTGHSMGGHGTWHIGATFPDKFAAIAPSAGWISFWSYRYLNNIANNSPVINLINRTGNPSDTYTLSKNYSQFGVYIIHGSADEVVRADQAYSMIDTLKKFHKDYVYHEEPDAGHWWDNNDEDGADCVDWQPMFDYFARHARPTKNRIKHIKFVTASPGISATNNWATIYNQEKYFEFSNIDIKFEPGKQRFVGETENVNTLALETDFLEPKKPLSIKFDNQQLDSVSFICGSKLWLKKTNGLWQPVNIPDPADKGPHRYGSFKEAFTNNMVFVYGTGGSREENEWSFNKSRFDAEQFWYQGNGAIEIISDKDFDSENYKNRNIILYGNSETNLLWNKLLSDCPIEVVTGKVSIGNKTFSGSDRLVLMTYPRKDSNSALVATVAATGIEGMRLAVKGPYFRPGVAYPDFVVINSKILDGDNSGFEAAGFFGSNWELESGELEIAE